MSIVVTGGCLCGASTYQFDSELVISSHHCHCTDCQKMTGSGKATIILVPTQVLEVNGELKTYTVTGSDGSHVTRGFCSVCGCQTMSYVEEMPDIRFIKAGTLDDSSWVTISSSYWSSSAQPWSPVDTSLPVFEKNPIM